MKRYSILQKEKKCYVCGKLVGLHTHEVYYGKNRQRSIDDGCCIYLCGKHHNLSKEGIHFNKELDELVKTKMQIAWQEYYNKSVDDFIKRFGKNYL